MATQSTSTDCLNSAVSQELPPNEARLRDSIIPISLPFGVGAIGL